MLLERMDAHSSHAKTHSVCVSWGAGANLLNVHSPQLMYYVLMYYFLYSYTTILTLIFL